MNTDTSTQIIIARSHSQTHMHTISGPSHAGITWYSEGSNLAADGVVPVWHHTPVLPLSRHGEVGNVQNTSSCWGGDDLVQWTVGKFSPLVLPKKSGSVVTDCSDVAVEGDMTVVFMHTTLWFSSELWHSRGKDVVGFPTKRIEDFVYVNRCTIIAFCRVYKRQH